MSGAQYEPRELRTAGGSDPNDTITNKAARVLGLAREVRDRARVIRDRTCRATAKADSATQAPNPEHVIFSLEGAEHELNEAIGFLNEAQGSI